ncbi:DUF4167 domain-containing protein [Bartonella sp. CB178]|uniref:DUF4167 domain-containing protein n=1 Tax=Bartonella sp. CB178 TaxID=3112255 RepID=UPI00300DC733
MRPQQNRRARGRSNNNNGSNSSRRGPNPLSRNYESSGPDVKIRGNAQQIADKYLSLARDAQGSGDRVMSENYLQHAEHYLRIILAASAQASQSVRRDEGSEQEYDEMNGESTRKDNTGSDESERYAQSYNGRKVGARNGYAGDEEPGTNISPDEISGKEKASVQESDEPVKKVRRTSRRRTVVGQDEAATDLARATQKDGKNGEVPKEKVSPSPLSVSGEETMRKTRRRRAAASRVETPSAEGNV